MSIELKLRSKFADGLGGGFKYNIANYHGYFL